MENLVYVIFFLATGFEIWSTVDYFGFEMVTRREIASDKKEQRRKKEARPKNARLMPREEVLEHSYLNTSECIASDFSRCLIVFTSTIASG